MTAVWFDEDDPFAGQRDYPTGFCIGCGIVNEKSDVRAHETNCPGRIYSPVACRRCSTINWKRDECRCCGKPIE